MRKNKRGRPPKKLEIKKVIQEMRDKELSFAEIGEVINMSRQLVQYYYYRKLSIGDE